MKGRTFEPAAGRAFAISSVAFLGFLFAADLGAQGRSIRFDRLTPEQGLSQATVNCVLQDSVGFMWFGTQDGLNRYDGREIRVYERDPADEGSLAGNWIMALVDDPSGDLWVGTEGAGLGRWHRASDSFSHYRHDPGAPGSLSSDRVWTLLLDRAGVLWVGTFQSGLNRFDETNGTFERFRHDPADSGSLSDDRVRAITEDQEGNLWIGTLAGLNRLNGESGDFERFRHHPADAASLSDDGILSIREDHQGRLWVGTEGGLNRRDPAGPGFVRYLADPADPASLSDDHVRVLFEDRDRRLWVGTDGGLDLVQDRPGGFAHYRHDAADPESLSNDRIMSIFQDRGGVVWIGTQGGGLNKWSPTTWSFSHYRVDSTSADSLNSNAVFAFSEDAEGTLWIGTFGGGLNVFDRSEGRFTYFRHDPGDPTSLSDDRVSSLLHDRGGTLWVGTLAGGLNRLDPESGAFRRYRADPGRPGSLSNDVVTSLYEDRRGDVWVGTYAGGLNRFDRETGTFEYHRHDAADPRSLGDDQVTSFAEGVDGLLWVGTFGGGLNRFDTVAFRRYLHDPDRLPSLSSNTVYSLHRDGAGVLWIGTSAGLNKLESFEAASGEEAFEHFFERDGLPNNSVWGIRSDSEGMLWLSTNSGLSRFDPQRKTFKNYDRSHGLQGDEFNFGAHFRSRSGELFFGGTGGFNAFDPDRIETNTMVPPVVLTAFTRFNEPVDFGRPVFDIDEIPLSYRDHFLTFEFAALDFTAPERNRYRYRLEGFDDAWVDHGTERRVTFASVEPGRYTLQVQGSNNDGVWNEEGLALEISVAPPFWQTWWFRLAALIALSGLLLSAHQVRTHRIRKNAERLRILVDERTRELEEAHEQLVRKEKLATLGELAGGVAHEIRTPLSIINNTLFMLRRKLGSDERAERGFGRIQSQVQRANRIVGELLDFARGASADFRRFPLQEAAGQALGEVEVPPAIEVERRLDEDPLEVEADATQVQRILANLLDNAVQAMPGGGTLRLECTRVGEEAVVSVIDTGEGIPEEHLAKVFEPLFTTRANGIGLGLSLSQRYARSNRGRIECDSLPGRGAVFRLLLPVAPDHGAVSLRPGKGSEDRV